ncbi:MAG: cytochrome c1 [Proteobacteria bacterium]|nr:cytochrome c1 [Pseudomonadota bacterium]
MKKMLFAILVFLPGFAFAAGGETPIELDAMEPNLEDQASLQRGAKTYLNYCMACHSLKYQRYQRTADDLGIPVDLMMEHMVFDSSAQIGSLMDNAMSVDNAKQWFGSVPPDLTMYTMLKGGPEYLYTYMRVFYEDKTRPFGVNNLLFENVGMPHPLIELQGLQRKVCKQIPRLAENGGEMRDPLTGDPITQEQCGNDLLDRGFSPLELVEGTGSLTPEEYDQVIYDLANFLYYTVDPSRLDRERIGIYVLLFLAFFFVFTWLLGREYTKEFH